MLDALQFEFMRHAVVAGILVSVACGVVGTFVVLNRSVFITAGIAHAAYGGIGLGYFLGVRPVWTALGFSVAAAVGMGTVQRITRERSDTLIGVMWAVGMAIGVVLVDLTKGYKADLMSYLFGSILSVPQADLWLMLVLDVLILLFVWWFRRELVALSFDEDFAAVQGVPVTALYLTLVAVIGLTVVMMMKVVGLILVIALLTIPAAISAMFVRAIWRMMLLASLLGMAFTLTGLWLAYRFDLTSGASIILVAGLAYLLSLGIKTWRTRLRVCGAG